jgi:hypothetical protein
MSEVVRRSQRYASPMARGRLRKLQETVTNDPYLANLISEGQAQGLSGYAADH